MQSSITIDGVLYKLIKEQRSGLSIYRSNDAYLRLGEPDQIDRDLASHKRMADAGYPVALLTGEGTHGESKYFIERSLGDKTFRTLFEEDIVSCESISDIRFEEFMRIVERYVRAQVKTVVPEDRKGFELGVHLDLIRAELPLYEISLQDKFDRVCEKLAGFPYVLSHGDFNPANLYPLGVIDLEDVFPAPFGYDAITALANIEWFPLSPEYEYFAHYSYTPGQKEKYLAMCDGVSRESGLSPVSAYYDDFAFCRAIWSTVRMHKWPKLQKWRYDKFVRMYLQS